MSTNQIILPPYPRGGGQSEAVRLAAKRAQYKAAAATLREELELVEDAFTEAFAEVDRRQTTRDRLRDLASANRQKTRRG